MRRVEVDDQLSSIPSGALIEACQDAKNADSANDQYFAASLLATKAEFDALDTVVKEGGRTAVTATADGTGTGLIPATAMYVHVTSDDATKQVSLPAAVAGKRLRIFVESTGAELISAVATDKVNNVVVGATNEAALVAGTLYTLIYTDTGNWVMQGLTALGAVETAVIPDAL